jgi:hypothetical protein
MPVRRQLIGFFGSNYEWIPNGPSKKEGAREAVGYESAVLDWLCNEGGRAN